MTFFYRKNNACISEQHYFAHFKYPLTPQTPLFLGQNSSHVVHKAPPVQTASSFILACLARDHRPRTNLLKWSLFIQFIKQGICEGFSFKGES